MELQGERRLPVDRATAWAALNDPDRLRAAIPGCEAMERTGENRYRVEVGTSLGPVRAKFGGNLQVEDLVAPESYSLRFEGQGGAAGFASGMARVRLTDEGASTLVVYHVNAQVGGRIAQLGSRLIDSAALKIADDFFAAFERQLAAPGTAAPGTAAHARHEESMLEELESSFVLHDPRTWNWLSWVVLLVVVVVLAALLLH